ncbi:MAG: hypothetical protein CMP11_09495 [Zetaproteobacteria bacterium]|nr:hypothetical protein [Pseudobdellovibrionaceae bacterium]
MKNFFRIISFLEGSSFVLLLFIAVPLKYWFGMDSFVKFLGMPHGIFFLSYILFALVLAIEEKWKLKTLSYILVASVIPFATFYVDKKFLRKSSS